MANYYISGETFQDVVRYRSRARTKKTASFAPMTRENRTPQPRKEDLRNTAEKAADKEKQEKRRKELCTALADAQRVLKDEAAKLHERFGDHSLEWYQRAILQDARITKTQRSPNRWNIFQREALLKMNGSTCTF